MSKLTLKHHELRVIRNQPWVEIQRILHEHEQQTNWTFYRRNEHNSPNSLRIPQKINHLLMQKRHSHQLSSSFNRQHLHSPTIFRQNPTTIITTTPHPINQTFLTRSESTKTPSIHLPIHHSQRNRYNPSNQLLTKWNAIKKTAKSHTLSTTNPPYSTKRRTLPKIQPTTTP